ncbi:S41 family peptidase [Botrimarina mediterranea]|uniref:Putative CtpA-like serine protease n=1 Tax=Botrimarina mediterranea TaxID=2528022 RepID=A0A518KEX7_9BACT|nr:S41 family peptidase [Botrimarina mediterranea]QDV76332.1 putative CtpA-like serine protease [Botrimarina mediterranea]QDV80930.1 putative CtpA-like serine protease [Planctomycetes bacterium K2D]
MSRRNLTVLFVALAIGLLCYTRSERNPYARYVGHAYELVDDYALEQPTDRELFAGAMQGIVGVLRQRGDVHSDFLDPRKAEPFMADIRQEFGGVGVRVSFEGTPPRIVVVEPPQPGTPAYASPIRVKDQILTVDGKPTEGLGLQDVVGMMRGKVGAPVSLTVRHEGGAEETFQLVRAEIRVPSVIGDRPTADGGWRYELESEPRVALLRVTSFGNRTSDELAAALKQVVDDGAEAVVLDFRGNPGGPLDTAVRVCELFLPKESRVVTIRGRDGEVQSEFATSADGPYLDLPLAVLVDGDTASASEIVAAALQDHGRAVVVGQRSYGKGTVQQMLELEPGHSMLKLTTASFWRPSGVNIHRLPGTPESVPWGVSPDEGAEVPMTDKERIAWYEWRRNRDLVGATTASDGSAESDPLVKDPTLAKAVERLDAMLGERP